MTHLIHAACLATALGNLVVYMTAKSRVTYPEPRHGTCAVEEGTGRFCCTEWYGGHLWILCNEDPGQNIVLEVQTGTVTE